MNDERVLHALKALAEHDRLREAPPESAIRIRAQFRLRRSRRIWRRAAVGALAAAAVAIIAVMLRTAPEVADQTVVGVSVVQPGTGAESRAMPSMSNPVASSASDRVMSADGKQIEQASIARRRFPPKQAAARVSALANPSLKRHETEVTPASQTTAQQQMEREVNPGEIMTDFFPLMIPAPPFDRGQLLRVNMPASAMQIVGLPVREDRMSEPIQADVLVGEEGLPRAIRFVGFEQARFAGK